MLWRKSAKPARKTKILYVDDDPFMRALVESALESAGAYELCVGSNGTEAIDNLHWFEPDLIMLDVMMPGLAGTHTFQILRIEPAYRNVPIIFITARTGPEDLEKYQRLGAAAVIGKPFTADQLLKTVKECCEAKAGVKA